MTTLLLKLLDWLVGALSVFPRIRVRAHLASMLDDDQLCLFINVTNRSAKNDVELTHVWLETQPTVEIVNENRPLPRRLRPRETWETWVPLSDVPSAQISTLLYQARVRLSTSDHAFKSRPNRKVRPVGYVPGA